MRGAASGRGDRGERRSVVQAMRAANRGKRRSPAFEVSSLETTGAASMQKLLKQARASGSLNLTSRGLEEIPEQVFNLIGAGSFYMAFMRGLHPLHPEEISHLFSC